ncbi:hypothetical protein NQ315_000159 [Exocentrus adspersus]|uniref:Methylated-DNA--protein-cysteine methyltransferase n=1 Tax=Exocentrus adspersus TaxID=1586481 RepID=A0AAV8VPZ9_9CUCU|nr:hypothetical protein NQ315_000159 [Exocentrus adspersus]
MLKCAISKLTHEEYKKLRNFQVTYGVADSKFGKCCMALHGPQICFASFVNDAPSESVALQELKAQFPKASFTEDNTLIQAKAEVIFDDSLSREVEVLLKGTSFQIKVWEELVNLPRGSTCSYEDVAKALGNSKAVRAVANSVAKNKVAYLVPCHRVIKKGGGLGKYRSGPERKLRILKDEKALPFAKP